MPVELDRVAASYASHLDFYERVYGDCIVESRTAGRTGATMVWARQAAGDWSDAPTPDLVLALLPTPAVGTAMDFGAGRFGGMMKTGDLIIVPPRVATSILMDAAHDVRALGIPYGGLLALAGGADESGLPADGDFGRLHAGFFADPTVAGLLERLWVETRSGSPHGGLFADGALLQLGAALLRLRDGAAREPVHAGGLAPWQVRRVTDLLDARADGVSLAELAAAVGLSAHHFCRAFKRSTGLPPHAWLVARRVERAKALLASSDLSVREVAAAVGYDDPNQLARVFRKAVGVSPSAWRRHRWS